MYIDKLIKKEVITLLISVAFLVVVFIGVTFAKFLSVDKGEKTVINMGDLNISFCNNSTCDTTYSNIGQVIGTKVENGVTVPASIYPFPDDGTYSNETPYIFKIENTGSLDSTVKIKLKEDATYTPTGDYSSYTRLSLKYPEHLKVAIRKRVLYQDTGYQLGDVNMDGIVNVNDAELISGYFTGNNNFSSVQIKLADVTKDGNIDMRDSLLVRQLLAGAQTTDIEPFYIYSYADLEDGVIFKDDTIKAGESATYFLWLYLDESTPNDVQNTFFVGNIDVEGEFIPRNTVFCNTDTELTDGVTYVNGQYTYTYRGPTNDWKVVLTDKTSTDPVTSEVCTYINNKPITTMASMFNKSQTTSIDLSNVNTSNVTHMGTMFANSQATTIKGLESFDTSKVTSMASMFRNSKVSKLDLSNFDTSSLTSTNGMFGSSTATVIDVSGFNTSNVINMGNMFAGSQATTIKGLESFDTSKVTNMVSMFYGSQATILDLSSFNTSKVTNMSKMFLQNNEINTIYVSEKWNTSNVTSSSFMFQSCTFLVGAVPFDSTKTDVSMANYTNGYLTYKASSN